MLKHPKAKDIDFNFSDPAQCRAIITDDQTRLEVLQELQQYRKSQEKFQGQVKMLLTLKESACDALSTLTAKLPSNPTPDDITEELVAEMNRHKHIIERTVEKLSELNQIPPPVPKVAIALVEQLNAAPMILEELMHAGCIKLKKVSTHKAPRRMQEINQARQRLELFAALCALPLPVPLHRPEHASRPDQWLMSQYLRKFNAQLHQKCMNVMGPKTDQASMASFFSEYQNQWESLQPYLNVACSLFVDDCPGRMKTMMHARHIFRKQHHLPDTSQISVLETPQQMKPGYPYVIHHEGKFYELGANATDACVGAKVEQYQVLLHRVFQGESQQYYKTGVPDCFRTIAEQLDDEDNGRIIGSSGSVTVTVKVDDVVAKWITNEPDALAKINTKQGESYVFEKPRTLTITYPDSFCHHLTDAIGAIRSLSDEHQSCVQAIAAQLNTSPEGIHVNHNQGRITMPASSEVERWAALNLEAHNATKTPITLTISDGMLMLSITPDKISDLIQIATEQLSVIRQAVDAHALFTQKMSKIFGNRKVTIKKERKRRVISFEAPVALQKWLRHQQTKKLEMKGLKVAHHAKTGHVAITYIPGQETQAMASCECIMEMATSHHSYQTLLQSMTTDQLSHTADETTDTVSLVIKLTHTLDHIMASTLEDFEKRFSSEEAAKTTDLCKQHELLLETIIHKLNSDQRSPHQSGAMRLLELIHHAEGAHQNQLIQLFCILCAHSNSTSTKLAVQTTNQAGQWITERDDIMHSLSEENKQKLFSKDLMEVFFKQLVQAIINCDLASCPQELIFLGSNKTPWIPAYSFFNTSTNRLIQPIGKSWSVSTTVRSIKAAKRLATQRQSEPVALQKSDRYCPERGSPEHFAMAALAVHFKSIDAYNPEQDWVKIFINYPEDYRPTTINYQLVIQVFCHNKKITHEFYGNGFTLQLHKDGLAKTLGALNQFINECKSAESAPTKTAQYRP